MDSPDSLLVGQTVAVPAVQDPPVRPGSSLDSSARAHLGPIDADEALELLTRLRPGRELVSSTRSMPSIATTAGKPRPAAPSSRPGRSSPPGR